MWRTVTAYSFTPIADTKQSKFPSSSFDLSLYQVPQEHSRMAAWAIALSLGSQCPPGKLIHQVDVVRLLLRTVNTMTLPSTQ